MAALVLDMPGTTNFNVTLAFDVESLPQALNVKTPMTNRYDRSGYFIGHASEKSWEKFKKCGDCLVYRSVPGRRSPYTRTRQRDKKVLLTKSKNAWTAPIIFST